MAPAARFSCPRQGAVLSLRATEKLDSRQSVVRITMVGADPHGIHRRVEKSCQATRISSSGMTQEMARTDVPNYGKSDTGTPSPH